jgi:hypothetical protein
MKTFKTMFEDETASTLSRPARGFPKQLPVSSIILAGAMLLTLPCVIRGQSALDYGQESLNQAVVNEVSALEGLVGQDPSLNLQYNYVVNSDGTFSWSTVSGQMYDGQTFSVSGTGTYDSATTTDDWTASGQVGSSPLSEQGEVVWTGDPTGTVSGTVGLFGATYTVSGNVQLTAGTGNVKWNSASTSGHPITFTLSSNPNNVPNLNPSFTADVKDIIYTDGTCSITSTSTNNPFSFTGTFVNSNLSVVPEPSSLALMGVGAIGVLTSMRRRYAKG